jgi:hypothetical protein
MDLNLLSQIVETGIKVGLGISAFGGALLIFAIIKKKYGRR